MMIAYVLYAVKRSPLMRGINISSFIEISLKISEGRKSDRKQKNHRVSVVFPILQSLLLGELYMRHSFGWYGGLL